MLTISLHGIVINAPIGLYPEEKKHGNTFETDIDIWVPDAEHPWPFVDYAIVNKIVQDVYKYPCELLETLVHHIHSALKGQFPMAEKIRVTVRKMNPPMPGEVNYSQVCYEL